MAFDIATAKPVQQSSGFDISTAKPVQQNSDFSVVEMVSNIPGSAANLAGNMYQAVRHPVQTAEGLGKVASGALSQGNKWLDENTPEFLDFMSKPIGGGSKVFGEEFEPYSDALKAALIDRYGGAENVKKTVEQDPVGFAADVAGILTGVGLAKTGAAVNPINATINSAKYVAGKAVPKGLPKSMYESIAKFGTTISDKKRSSMIDTALKHEIPPTAKGAAKLEGLIDGFNKQIDGLITASTNNGESIPASAVYKHLKSLRQQKGGMSLDAPSDIKSINRVVSNFQKHLKEKGKSRLTPAELQQLKINTYNSINFDAKRLTGTPIKEDTYKAVARGAKEGVESMVPEVKGVNRSLGELYELQPHLQRSASRIENKNAVSLTDPLDITAGAMVGGTPGGIIGAVVAFLGKDKIKGNNAIRLQKLANNAKFKTFVENNPNISKAELMAVISGRQPIEND